MTSNRKSAVAMLMVAGGLCAAMPTQASPDPAHAVESTTTPEIAPCVKTRTRGIAPCVKTKSPVKPGAIVPCVKTKAGALAPCVKTKAIAAGAVGQ